MRSRIEPMKQVRLLGRAVRKKVSLRGRSAHLPVERATGWSSWADSMGPLENRARACRAGVRAIYRE
jgi:hypothetical protein